MSSNTLNISKEQMMDLDTDWDGSLNDLEPLAWEEEYDERERDAFIDDDDNI
jgi:hypothetical protein